MAIARSRITAQGQITIPAKVRKKLGLGPGSLVEWEQEGERIVVRRAGRYSSEEVHGAIFAEPPRPRSLEELRDGVREHVRKRHARR